MDRMNIPHRHLLDLYTIEKELSQNNKSLDGLRIALVGDLKYGRAVHSLCKVLSLYSNVSMSLISPEELRLPINFESTLRIRSNVVQTENLERRDF